MRVSTDTIDAMHEMIGADWFLGSMSGLSTQVIGSLGRGILLLPRFDCGIRARASECFHAESGDLPMKRVSLLWKEYARAFEHYIPRPSALSN